jgi:unsaturated rhamnogalacturonyl hydrolase
MARTPINRFILVMAIATVSPAQVVSRHNTLHVPEASVGDAPANPGPLARDLSSAVKPDALKGALRRVADWQTKRIADTPSLDWTYATLYIGMLAASNTLSDPRYHDTVLRVANHYRWTTGLRQAHADDQAIGQSYLTLYGEDPIPGRIGPLKGQFDKLVETSDDPGRPVWWWCDALFTAPPVWSGLGKITHDPKYLTYMDHEWHITAGLLWDPQERLLFRDKAYLSKQEKNGRKVFWPRCNDWVMGGIVQILENMPDDDPRRSFYVEKLQAMADAVAELQGKDALWRASLLDEGAYPFPEVSGSAFFIYAITWGVRHNMHQSATKLWFSHD